MLLITSFSAKHHALLRGCQNPSSFPCRQWSRFGILTWKAKAWHCPTVISLYGHGYGGQEPCWEYTKAQQMVTLLRASYQTTFFSKQKQSGVLAGHVGFLCTNTVGWWPVLFFGSCEPGNGANLSNTQSLKGFHIPLLKERNPWILCLCFPLNSTDRKAHLWCIFTVFTNNDRRSFPYKLEQIITW